MRPVRRAKQTANQGGYPPTAGSVRRFTSLLDKRASLFASLAVATLVRVAPAAADAPAALGDAATATSTAPTEVAIDPDLPPRAVSPAEQQPWLKTSMVGFIDSRTTGAYARVTRLLPADDTPHLSQLTEANLQIKLDLRDRARIYGDVSWVYARGGYYFGDDGDRQRTALANHDVASVRPGAFVSELYGLFHFDDHWNLTLGKKRVVWGSGLAWNPTDLLNPPKDPTDPTQQRSGSWLARLEGQFERMSVSFIGAGKTTRQSGGIPSGLVYYPDNQPELAFDATGAQVADGRDDQPHALLAARVYALVANSDVQLFAYYSHLYNDAFRNKPRLGGSVSRVVGDSWEVHGEWLAQRGSSRTYFNDACTQDMSAAMACTMAGTPIAAANRLDDDAPRWKGLLGLRYQFGEAASVSAEYFYNAEGYSAKEFTAFAGALDLRRSASRQGLTLPASAFGGLAVASTDPGTPQKYAFEPLRRHYLFLTYLHPQLANDFTINAVVLLGLEDLSGQLVPQLTWSARQWLNLSVGAFVALPGIPGLGAQTSAGEITEMMIQPTVWRAFFAARAFF